MRGKTASEIHSPNSGHRARKRPVLKPRVMVTLRDRDIISTYFRDHAGELQLDINREGLWNRLRELGLRCVMRNLYSALQSMSHSVSCPLKRAQKDGKQTDPKGWGYVWPKVEQ